MTPAEFEYIPFRQTLSRCYRQHFAELLAQTGLTPLQAELLLFLHRAPPGSTATEFIRLYSVPKASVSVACRGLREQGLILCRPDPDSRRTLGLFLSERGSAAAAALAQCRSAFWRQILSALPHQGGEALLRQLWQLRQTLSAALPPFRA